MIRIVLYTNVISPHQLPLAKELVASVGNPNFRYIYTKDADKDHGGLGWTLDVPDWCIHADDVEANEWIENADTLLSGLRCFDLFERRAKKGLKNFYMTERWFKPPIGILRLLHPRYFGYAKRLCKLMESGAVVGLPIGIHAARDMARLCGLAHGDFGCLLGAPELEFEHKPGGRIFNHRETCRGGKKYCLDKMRIWGYFVEASHQSSGNRDNRLAALKVLWVGRLLDWKCVDTIIQAVGSVVSRQSLVVNNGELVTNDHQPTTGILSLDICGTGPEEARLKKMAAKYGDAIKFYPPVPIAEVRKLMREHDVYVLSSNAYEGWGAVVSEALEEGMLTLGTHEAGASATLLPNERLFHSGDVGALATLLELEGKSMSPSCSIGEWTAAKAAEWMLVVCR